MTMVNPAFSQVGFRAYNDGTQSASLAIADENANWYQNPDVLFLIRFVVDETAGGALANAVFKLQYNLGGAGWNDVTTASSVVRAVASSSITDEEATTRRLTSGTGTFLAGACSEDGIAGGTQIDFAGGEVTELVYVCQIQTADVSNGDTIQLRVVRNDTGTLDTFTQTPTITVAKGVKAWGGFSTANYLYRADTTSDEEDAAATFTRVVAMYWDGGTPAALGRIWNAHSAWGYNITTHAPPRVYAYQGAAAAIGGYSFASKQLVVAHFVLDPTNSQRSLYINGALYIQDTTTTAPTDVTTRRTIGGRDGTSQVFEPSPNVRVIGTASRNGAAMTAAQVREHYRAIVAAQAMVADADGVLAHALNAGTGTVDLIGAYDYSIAGAVTLEDVPANVWPVIGSGGAVAGGAATDEHTGGGNTYNETGSGGATTSGAATEQQTHAQVASSGATTSGAATEQQTHAQVASSGATTSGAATEQQTHVAISAGGAATSGDAAHAQTHVETSAGGAVAGGAATDNVSGGNTYNESASGGATTSGAATEQQTHAQVASSGAVAGGAATEQQTYAAISAGGATTSGDAAHAQAHVETSAGGATTSGDAAHAQAHVETSAGGAVTGGAANDNVTNGPQTYNEVGTGGAVAGGSAVAGVVVYEAATGTLAVAGAAVQTQTHAEIASGGADVDGTALHAQAHAEAAAGGAAAGGEAVDVHYGNVISESATGGFALLGSAIAKHTLRIPRVSDRDLLPKGVIIRPSAERMPFGTSGELLPDGPELPADYLDASDVARYPWVRRRGDEWTDRTFRAAVLTWVSEFFRDHAWARSWSIEERAIGNRMTARYRTPFLIVRVKHVNGTVHEVAQEFPKSDRTGDALTLRLTQLTNALEASII